jgi:hypothetical protein
VNENAIILGVHGVMSAVHPQSRAKGTTGSPNLPRAFSTASGAGRQSGNPMKHNLTCDDAADDGTPPQRRPMKALLCHLIESWIQSHADIWIGDFGLMHLWHQLSTTSKEAV